MFDPLHLIKPIVDESIVKKWHVLRSLNHHIRLEKSLSEAFHEYDWLLRIPVQPMIWKIIMSQGLRSKNREAPAFEIIYKLFFVWGNLRYRFFDTCFQRVHAISIHIVRAKRKKLAKSLRSNHSPDRMAGVS